MRSKLMPPCHSFHDHRHVGTGVTDNSTSGLPFTQLQLCAAQAGVKGTVPKGTVAYVLYCSTRCNGAEKYDSGTLIPASPPAHPGVCQAAFIEYLVTLTHSWVPYALANGRFIVPGYDQNGPVSSGSFGLGNLEDRTHTHTFIASISTVSTVTYAPSSLNTCLFSVLRRVCGGKHR